MDNVRHCLIIGVNGYKPAIGQLRFCIQDAKRVHDALKMQRGGFTKSESTLLIDDELNENSPTRLNIMENVVNLCDKSSRDDTVLIYFSGHGAISEGGNLYLLPIDASSSLLEESAISWKWLNETIEGSVAKNKILILDACHSGTGRDVAVDIRKSFKIVDTIKQDVGGFICMTSCSQGQLSYELHDLGQGIFSYYLAKGLNGAADSLGRGSINIENLYEYVRERTVEHASRIGVEQMPFLISRVAAPLNTFFISSTSSDRPINHVLVITKDPSIGKFLEIGIQISTSARNATWHPDLDTAKTELASSINYDAIYLDVDNDWDEKKAFILSVREHNPTIPFVLVGVRTLFINKLRESNDQRFGHYYFFDLEAPLSRAEKSLSDTLALTEWYLSAGFGKNL